MVLNFSNLLLETAKNTILHHTSHKMRNFFLENELNDKLYCFSLVFCGLIKKAKNIGTSGFRLPFVAN